MHAHIMLTHLNIKDGVKAYCSKRDETILKAVKQIHSQQAIKPCNRHQISHDDRRKALQYLMFLNEKRQDNKSKGMRRQGPKEYTQAEECTSSPTISIEAFMLSCAIDAKVNRYVIVSDEPGTFLHTNI